MPSHFSLSVHFFAPAFHGRRDGGEPEWPPSPLRAFQSLVAAAAARWRIDGLAPQDRSALRWLECQSAPCIIAPRGVTASGYRLSVPNNAMDIVAKAWCRGNDSFSGDANPATHRTMKPVRPTLLLGGDTVHYLWPLADPLPAEVRTHAGVLAEIARSVVALGWGVDMVAGHGVILSNEQANTLSGERWSSSTGTAGDALRVPVQGTLDALIHRYERSLKRLGPDGFNPPPSLSTYASVRYRKVSDPPPMPVAAFSLLKVDADGFRSFDTARRALTVSGMMRHATKLAAEKSGWPEPKINAFILGHGGPNDGPLHVAVGQRRFAYLPMPSIEARGEGKARVVGDVRRVALFSFAEDCEDEMAWARRTLPGQELIDEDENRAVALIAPLPETDKIVRAYTKRVSSWATVTPVVLPGYDDPAHYRRRLKQGTDAKEQRKLLLRLSERIDGLLRKAIVQAGFSRLLAERADLEWRLGGFWPGVEPADRYGVPDHLRRFSRLHARICWRDACGKPIQVPGPICIGGGRFYGLGLFAAED